MNTQPANLFKPTAVWLTNRRPVRARICRDCPWGVTPKSTPPSSCSSVSNSMCSTDLALR